MRKSSRQGCTAQKSGLGMYQNHNFQFNPLKHPKMLKSPPDQPLKLSPTSESDQCVCQQAHAMQSVRMLRCRHEL